MPYFQALLLSLGIHILLAIWMAKLDVPASPKDTQAIEIVYESKNSKSFVQDPEIGQIIHDLQKQADYLSKLNRKVKKEMVARQSGKTQNRNSDMPMNELTNQKQKKTVTKIEELLPKGIGGYIQQKEIQEENESLTIMHNRAAQQPSTISTYIPNVEKGGFTALNTNSLLYYTFFSRIENQVRPRWVNHLRTYSSELTIAEINKLALKTRYSQIEILLDMTGMFANANIIQSSGFPELDRAAWSAFKDAAPFRNPPLEMIEGDGYIHLKYGFYVEWSPRYWAGSPNSN